MREHEEVQKMGHIVQRLVRNAIMQAVNQVIQKKTQQEAAKFGNEWKGSFHCLVSGYYSGMTVKYLMLPFAVFCILCAIGSGIAGGLTYSIWFLVIAVVCLVTRSYGMKMMRVIIYWDNGMAFYDKDGNEPGTAGLSAWDVLSGPLQRFVRGGRLPESRVCGR